MALLVFENLADVPLKHGILMIANFIYHPVAGASDVPFTVALATIALTILWLFIRFLNKL